VHFLANNCVDERADGGPGRKHVGAVMRRTTGDCVIRLQCQGIDTGAVVHAALQSLARKHELRACVSRQDHYVPAEHQGPYHLAGHYN
jgi:hypothetical protein